MKSAGRSCPQPRRQKIMPLLHLRPPEWRLERHGMAAQLHLTGDWIARETGIRSAAEVCRVLNEAAGTMLRVDASNLGLWDSALIAFLRMLRYPDLADAGRTGPVQIDESGLPEPTRRLLALAAAGGAEAAVTAVP